MKKILVAASFMVAMITAFAFNSKQSKLYTQVGYALINGECISGPIDQDQECSPSGTTQCTFRYGLGNVASAHESCTGTPPVEGFLLKYN